MIRTPALILTSLALTACAPQSDKDSLSPSGERGSQSANPAATTPTTPTPALAIEAEGLRLFTPTTGSARPIPFGTARAQVMTALASRGTAETGTNGECGAGPLAYARWPDGLTLWFQQDALTGWALNAPASDASPAATAGVSTASGLTIGSTRADLDSAYAATVEQSTLGTEFAAGELFGLLDGEGQGARVTALWAGVSCNFR